MITIQATTIPDAWFQLIYCLLVDQKGVTEYQIDSGSYVGQRRLEFDFAVVEIANPGIRPLIPTMPEGSTIPPPVAPGYVREYFSRYLMSDEIAENETYTYGSWLVPGIERVIEQLRGAPGNNQATISIGGWAADSPSIYGGTWEFDTDDYIDPATGQRDPACLRVVDFRLDQSNRLSMIVYFRSWDLWGGFPANLAGLQLVKEYVAQAIDSRDGKIIACSKGLHLYDHCWEIARMRVGK
jgi:thymidylate synthase